MRRTHCARCGVRLDERSYNMRDVRCEECTNWFVRGMNERRGAELDAFIAAAKAEPVRNPDGSLPKW